MEGITEGAARARSGVRLVGGEVVLGGLHQFAVGRPFDGQRIADKCIGAEHPLAVGDIRLAAHSCCGVHHVQARARRVEDCGARPLA